MEQTTRTAWGAYLQTCLLLNLPWSLMTDTTLNEKFNVQAGVAPASGVIPTQRYYCIGNGGATISVGSNGVTAPSPLQHEATDAALFNHLPFIMRPVASDLSASQMAQYALRVVQTYNGTAYACYYLRRIDFTNVAAQIQMNTVTNGQTTTTPYVANTANLNPTPPATSSGSVSTVSGDYLTAAAILGLSFSAQDAAELVNCANIIYGDPRYAIISEVGLVSGVDSVVQVAASGGSFNMTECISAQINSFIDTFIPMNYMNNGTTINLNVGSTEPLFQLASSSSGSVSNGSTT
jgi:hypothetical protein